MKCGILAKGIHGGSNAGVWIYPIEKERLEGLDELVGHDVWDISFVEIKKV